MLTASAIGCIAARQSFIWFGDSKVLFADMLVRYNRASRQQQITSVDRFHKPARLYRSWFFMCFSSLYLY